MMDELSKEVKKSINARYFHKQRVSDEKKKAVLDTIRQQRNNKISYKGNRYKEWISVTVCCFLLFFLGQFTLNQIAANKTQDSQGNEQRNSISIKLKGNVIANKKHIRLFGKSQLPEGAFITTRLQGLEGEKLLIEKMVKVDRKGNFEWTEKRPDRLKEYVLIVSFLPEEQTKAIQAKYGKRGERIENSETGKFKYLIKGKEYTGLKLYDRIIKLDYFEDGVGDSSQSTFLLNTLPK
jgi:hypothetical protein